MDTRIKTILYSVVTDKEGNLIKTIDAEKGNGFFCSLCKTELILRKSGNTGKGSKRPHFAHRASTPDYAPETTLHSSFKNLLVKKINGHILSQTPILISWNCKFCGLRHSGHLLERAVSVKAEHNLGICQPDIALFDKDKNVFAVIEVVVTHKPSPNIIKFYNDNNIILIQINLSSERDIDELENKLATPDIVAFCYHPKCKICGHFLQKTFIKITDSPCWKCGSTMKLATVSSSNGGPVRGMPNLLSPSYFTDSEIDFAKSRGVFLKLRESKYRVNTCSACGYFVENFYLYRYTALADFPSETFETGYNCEYCENEKLR